MSFSDDVTFHLSGNVNLHSLRICESNNAHEVIEHTRIAQSRNCFVLCLNKKCSELYFAECSMAGIVYVDMVCCSNKQEGDGLLKSQVSRGRACHLATSFA
jgi:hypothetical protein